MIPQKPIPSNYVRPMAAAVIGCIVLLGAIGAHAANPPIRMSNRIEYMSGGIGSDEAKFMETVSPQWAATLEFAVKDATDSKGADFAAGVKVQVRDASTGASVLDATSNGPFFVARLNPGTYDVEATLHGQTLKQKLTVHVGEPSKALFEWPHDASHA